jgi:methionine-rich copper-binding protein CopC
VRSLLFAALLIASPPLAGAAFAHAFLQGVAAGDGGPITVGSQAITVSFDGPIELRFSRFALLPLTLPEEVEALLAAGDARRAEAIASERVAAFRKGGADGALALTPDPASGASKTVTLTLEVPLAAGAYALAVEALAQDGHVMREHRLLIVAAP